MSLSYWVLLFFFKGCANHLDLHSFPTRRSSDLAQRFFGKGVQKAVEHVNTEICEAILGLDVSEQAHIDQVLIDLDGDRKSTRLNSSHMSISYAVFCLKKKKKLE